MIYNKKIWNILTFLVAIATSVVLYAEFITGQPFWLSCLLLCKADTTVVLFVWFSAFLWLGFEHPKLECQSELGMKSGNIPNSAISATSSWNQYYGPERARLNTVKSGSFRGAWVAETQDIGQFIEVDLGKITKITRLATQGREDSSQWVKSYCITYSVEGGPFLPYNNNQVDAV